MINAENEILNFIETNTKFSNTITNKLLDHQKAIEIVIQDITHLAVLIEKLALAIQEVNRKVEVSQKKIHEIRKTPLHD